MVMGIFTPIALFGRKTITSGLRNAFVNQLRLIVLLLRRILVMEALGITPALRPTEAGRALLAPCPGQPQTALDADDPSL